VAAASAPPQPPEELIIVPTNRRQLLFKSLLSASQSAHVGSHPKPPTRIPLNGHRCCLRYDWARGRQRNGWDCVVYDSVGHRLQLFA
jgi:hypothetical protein